MIDQVLLLVEPFVAQIARVRLFASVRVDVNFVFHPGCAAFWAVRTLEFGTVLVSVHVPATDSSCLMVAAFELAFHVLRHSRSSGPFVRRTA